MEARSLVGTRASTPVMGAWMRYIHTLSLHTQPTYTLCWLGLVLFLHKHLCVGIHPSVSRVTCGGSWRSALGSRTYSLCQCVLTVAALTSVCHTVWCKCEWLRYSIFIYQHKMSGVVCGRGACGFVCVLRSLRWISLALSHKRALDTHRHTHNSNTPIHTQTHTRTQALLLICSPLETQPQPTRSATPPISSTTATAWHHHHPRRRPLTRQQAHPPVQCLLPFRGPQVRRLRTPSMQTRASGHLSMTTSWVCTYLYVCVV